MNLTQKITKVQLGYILGVCYTTARKEYQIILDSLNLKRNYLINEDLIKYGIFQSKK